MRRMLTHCDYLKCFIKEMISFLFLLKKRQNNKKLKLQEEFALAFRRDHYLCLVKSSFVPNFKIR